MAKVVSGVLKVFIECKNATHIDQVKEVLTRHKDNKIVQKLMWLSYGGGKDLYKVPPGMPPSEVLVEHWGDTSLEKELGANSAHGISQLLKKNKDDVVDNPSKAETLWVKKLRRTSAEEARILVGTTEGDFSEWNIDHHTVKEIYGDDVIPGTDIMIVNKPMGRPPKRLGE